MATYRLKRKLFGLVGTGLKAMGGGSKGWGIVGVASMGSEAVQHKQGMKETEAQGQQMLQEQKEKLKQLNQIAKS